MVFTMPADIATQPLQQQIQLLQPLCERIKSTNNVTEKLEIINAQPQLRHFALSPILKSYLNQMGLESQYVIKAIIAIGQGPVLLNTPNEIPSFEQFSKLVETLCEVENFYATIGGIIGYHLTVLKLIVNKDNNEQAKGKNVSYYKPEGIDLIDNSLEVRQAVRWGIEHLKNIAEIYAVGGAADRLKLRDETTQEFLPSARLLFTGRTLLEGLIRDLQGREYVYYKLFKKQLFTPIAMMTSHEKNNHEHIVQLCENNKWFGRPQQNFRLFIQPLVPVITKEGNWATSSKYQLMLKPGGHGVIWKQALDAGVFGWLEGQGRYKALVRQINNPVAGIDNGLLALTGMGCEKNKDFGFASCFRLINTSEGMNVLIERKNSSQKYEYGISNIEYTDFEQQGIKDAPESPGSLYSRFPANTNILFVDLKAIKEALKICPIPGMLINMKSTVPSVNAQGQITNVQAGRLESTMQNIADVIVDKFSTPLKEGERNNLRTFLTYNLRRKTLSVTKEAYVGKTLVGTPEGCFFELMQNYHDLLSNYCHIEMPFIPLENEYIANGPSFIVDFHPALGPLYHIIAQKIRGGLVAPGSEWVMEIAEADIENLTLNGSLHIRAENVLGQKDSQGIIHYGTPCGKCILKNVSVENKGINRNASNQYWKREISHEERLEIILHGNAEFIAENVNFYGTHRLEVPDGHRMVATEKEGKLSFFTETLSSPSWEWEFSFGHDDQVLLNKVIY